MRVQGRGDFIPLRPLTVGVSGDPVSAFSDIVVREVGGPGDVSHY